MNARDVIWNELKSISHLPERDTNRILGALTQHGHIIMKKEDVEAIRDKALEEAAALADERAASRARLYAENNAGINAHKSVEAEMIAVAIRSLKSGGKPSWAPHDLIPGRSYQSQNFGLVAYVGLDNYHGQVTHQFNTPHGSRFILPDALNSFLDSAIGSIKSEARG